MQMLLEFWGRPFTYAPINLRFEYGLFYLCTQKWEARGRTLGTFSYFFSLVGSKNRSLGDDNLINRHSSRSDNRLETRLKGPDRKTSKSPIFNLAFDFPRPPCPETKAAVGLVPEFKKRSGSESGIIQLVCSTPYPGPEMMASM